MSNSNILETKIEKVRSEENYCCLDWRIKFKCICKSCFRGSIRSPSTAESLGLKDFNFSLNLSCPLILTMTVFTENISDYLQKLANYRMIIGFRNSKNIMSYSCEYKNLHTFYDSYCYKNNYLYYLLTLQNKLIKCSNLQDCKFIVNGVLKITFELHKYVEVVDRNESYISSMVSDLKSFQNCKTFSDVTLVVGEKEFFLHKAILASRSSVFYAMFESEMQEKIENKVTIEDVSVEVMEHVFNYIYTDRVVEEDCKKLIDDILAIADKYDLQGLVKICERVLSNILDTKNALKILAKANLYKLDSLKNDATNFIIENVKNIIETDEFEIILETSKLHFLKCI